MCGRFTQLLLLDRLAELYRAQPMKGLVAPPPRYNLAPSQNAIAVRPTGIIGERELVLLRWGLVPSWAKDPAVGNRMINARGETVAEKPAYRIAFKRRRCAIPCDGFYEWRREGRKAEPFFFRFTNNENFALAGLWEHWTATDGSLLETFSIITCDANAALSPIHDRMPVLLAGDALDRWLDPASTEADLRRLLCPFSPEAMTSFPVSTAVNSPRSEGEGLILPLENREAEERETGWLF